MKIRVLPLIVALLAAEASAGAGLLQPRRDAYACRICRGRQPRQACPLADRLRRVLDGDTFYMQIDGQPTVYAWRRSTRPNAASPSGVLTPANPFKA